MREYTSKEMKLLQANPYTFKVTKHKLYFTTEFKEAFWTGYQAGFAPRKLLSDLGYDTDMFGQKQIDSMVQSIKKQAESGEGFKQGQMRIRRVSKRETSALDNSENNMNKHDDSGTLKRLAAEVKYLRQEVEF